MKVYDYLEQNGISGDSYYYWLRKDIYLCTGYTDFRKGIDGLISIVIGEFALDPTEPGCIFFFAEGVMTA